MSKKERFNYIMAKIEGEAVEPVSLADKKEE